MSLLPPALGGKGEALASLLRCALGAGRTLKAVEALPGDASDRRYYRLRVGGPGAEGRAILMEGASPGPFLEVRAFLESKGLPVPSLYGADGGAGLVLLEDSGEETLEERLAREPGRAGGLYGEAVELLLRIQERCTEVREPDPGHPCRALRYAFDEDTFAAELHHARRFAFEGLLGLRAPAEEWEEDLRWLARSLAAGPLVFTHRDYHSRNLLVRPDGGLALVDFQDARLGPPLYDLASLLFDAYTRPAADLSGTLARRFREARPGGGGEGPSEGGFERALRIAGLQRDLKAIGTFAYQKRVRGTDRYLPAMGRAALLVREHLRHLPEAEGFARRLDPILGRLAEFGGEVVR